MVVVVKAEAICCTDFQMVPSWSPCPAPMLPKVGGIVATDGCGDPNLGVCSNDMAELILDEVDLEHAMQADCLKEETTGLVL